MAPVIAALVTGAALALIGVVIAFIGYKKLKKSITSKKQYKHLKGVQGMTEREHPGNTKEADIERSTEDIRQDIAKEKENISQTVEQIGERINEKLDWRGYVKDSPYWALGAAAGLGYLASRMFIRRTTPMERIMRPIAEEVRDSTRWPACWSRWFRPDQDDPDGYCHEGCRQLDKECNLGRCGKQWRRASTADRKWFNREPESGYIKMLN